LRHFWHDLGNYWSKYIGKVLPTQVIISPYAFGRNQDNAVNFEV